MGKGARERARRRSTDHLKVEVIDKFTLDVDTDRYERDEHLALINALTHSANRRGVVTGIVAVRSGKVNTEQLRETIESNPKAEVFVLTPEEES
jgi:adenylylsulfate kinase-like enzyme